MPFLECKNLTKMFGHVAAVSGVDLTIDRGEVLGLLGDNGAGKSTLIGMIAGIFFSRLRSISIRLYLPVAPQSADNSSVSRSRIIRGAPLSDSKPDNITFESRKTLTVFAIGLLIQDVPFLSEPIHELFDGHV